jgi:hypothetical protein
MGLKRFMLYADRPDGGETDVVYCWGFRGALAAARKMSEWLDGAAVVTQDLDTLEEARWVSGADSAHCQDCPMEPAETPTAGFAACPPQPREIESKRKLTGEPPAPETSYLQAEVDLHRGVTMRLRIEL